MEQLDVKALKTEFRAIEDALNAKNNERSSIQAKADIKREDVKRSISELRALGYDIDEVKPVPSLVAIREALTKEAVEAKAYYTEKYGLTLTQGGAI